MHAPASVRGFVDWALLGLGAAVIALIVAQIFPSVIPASASAQKL